MISSTSTWDVVVVGAGSSGAALAARLAEQPSCRVLLVEAGPDYRAADSPPEMHTGDQWAIADRSRFPQYQWLNLTARATTAQPPLPYPRGRGVGGSSAINWRIAFRPPLDDFEMWGDRWEPEAVLASFVRLEDDLLFGDAPYHGQGGPVPISRLGEDGWSTVDHGLRDAAVGSGTSWCPDLNAPGITGASMLPYSGVDGMRMSTNEAYLEPARGRPNLEVLGDALADRVLFAGQRAVGLRLIVDGAPVDVSCGEVVVSAGALHSPALLLRSGIGPADELDRLGIDPLVDLPVGEGLSDHLAVAAALPLTDAYRPASNERPLSVCVRASSGVDGCAADDLMVQSLSPASLDPFPYALFGVCLEQPLSTGRVCLRSTDPTVDPDVELGYLSDPLDRTRMRHGLRWLRDLIDHPALRAVGAGPASPYRVSWEGLPDVSGSFDDLSTDADVDRWMAETATWGLHASSTCALGRVLDPECRVLGVNDLRVADMSISPTVPRANTNLTAIMIGEHVAGLMGCDGDA